MNHHGGVCFVTVYALNGAGFAYRNWYVTPYHAHVAGDRWEVTKTLPELRDKLRADFPGAVNLGTGPDDPADIVETWALKWVADLKEAVT